MSHKRICSAGRDLMVRALGTAGNEISARADAVVRELRSRGLMTWVRFEIRGEEDPDFGVYRVEILRLTDRGRRVATQIADARACRQADPPRPHPSGEWPSWVREALLGRTIIRKTTGSEPAVLPFRDAYAEARGLAPEPAGGDPVWRRLVDDRIARELADHRACIGRSRARGRDRGRVGYNPAYDISAFAEAYRYPVMDADLTTQLATTMKRLDAMEAGRVMRIVMIHDWIELAPRTIVDHDPGDEDDGAEKTATHYHARGSFGSGWCDCREGTSVAKITRASYGYEPALSKADLDAMRAEHEARPLYKVMEAEAAELRRRVEELP